MLKCEGSGKPCRNYARQFVKKNGVWHRLCGTHARSFNFMGVEQVLGFVTPPDDNFDEQRMEEMSAAYKKSAEKVNPADVVKLTLPEDVLKLLKDRPSKCEGCDKQTTELTQLDSGQWVCRSCLLNDRAR